MRPRNVFFSEMGKQVDKCARQRKCRPKVEDSDEDKRKNEPRSHSETPSESSGSTCSIIFSRNSKCGDRLLEPFMNTWPRVVSDQLTEPIEQKNETHFGLVRSHPLHNVKCVETQITHRNREEDATLALTNEAEVV